MARLDILVVFVTSPILTTIALNISEVSFVVPSFMMLNAVSNRILVRSPPSCTCSGSLASATSQPSTRILDSANALHPPPLLFPLIHLPTHPLNERPSLLNSFLIFIYDLLTRIWERRRFSPLILADIRTDRIEGATARCATETASAKQVVLGWLF